MAKDLLYLADDSRLQSSQHDFAQAFEEAVLAYKAAVFPESMQQAAGDNVPDWNTEVGGLSHVKS